MGHIEIKQLSEQEGEIFNQYPSCLNNWRIHALEKRIVADEEPIPIPYLMKGYSNGSTTPQEQYFGLM